MRRRRMEQLSSEITHTTLKNSKPNHILQFLSPTQPSISLIQPSPRLAPPRVLKRTADHSAAPDCRCQCRSAPAGSATGGNRRRPCRAKAAAAQMTTIIDVKKDGLRQWFDIVFLMQKNRKIARYSNRKGLLCVFENCMMILGVFSLLLY